MGTVSLNATFVPDEVSQEDVVVHAMCAKQTSYSPAMLGDVTALVVNYANTSASVELNNTSDVSGSGGGRVEWHVRPEDPTNVTSRTAALRGAGGKWQSLVLNDQDALPELVGITQPSASK